MLMSVEVSPEIMGCLNLWDPGICDFALVAFNNMEIEAETNVGHLVCIQYFYSE